MFKQLPIINCTVLEEETQLLAHPVRGFLICGNAVLAIGVFTFFSPNSFSLWVSLPHITSFDCSAVWNGELPWMLFRMQEQGLSAPRLREISTYYFPFPGSDPLTLLRNLSRDGEQESKCPSPILYPVFHSTLGSNSDLKSVLELKQTFKW